MTKFWFLPPSYRPKPAPVNTDEPIARFLDAPAPSAGNLATQHLHGNLINDCVNESDEEKFAQPIVGHGGDGDKEKSPLPPRIAKRSANPGGREPGRMKNAREISYDVTGPTLSSITDQLHVAGGFAAETNAPIGLGGRIRP